MTLACPVCLAADHSEDPSILLRWQAIHLDRARAALLPLQVENGRLRDRERELLEIIERQNRRLVAGAQ
jgi:hypothetical protein